MRKVNFIFLILAIAFSSYFLGIRNGRPETYEFLLESREEVEAGNNVGNQWMIADPIRYKIGKYFLMLPKNAESNGSFAAFYEGGFPFLLAQDTNQNGIPNELIIKDEKGKLVAVTVTNDEFRIFDSTFITVSGTPNLNAITYIDEDFDGTPDVVYSDENGAKTIE